MVPLLPPSLLSPDQHSNLQEQVELYQAQYQAIEKDMGDSSKNFSHFKKEMERLGKQLRSMERDTSDWKEKYESSNDQGSGRGKKGDTGDETVKCLYARV